MIFVLAFFSLFLGCLLFTKYWVVSIPFFVVLIFIGFRKHKHVGLIVSILPFLFGVLTNINYGLVKDSINSDAIVISSKTNYILVYAKGERFYIYQKENEYEQGDILKVKGSVAKLSIYKIESEFDFEDYLHNKGVKREIKVSSISTAFKVPIRKKWIINQFLNNFSEESRTYIDGLLFSNIDYSSSLAKKLSVLNLINVFSISGIFLFILFEGVLFKFIKNEFIRRLAAIIVITPYIFFTFTKISILRVYLLKIVKLISLKIECLSKPRHLSELSFTGLVLLSLNPTFAFQSGFYIGFFISFLLYIFKQAFKVYGNVKQKLVGLFLLYILLLPILVRSRNEFNFLGIIYHYVYLGINLFSLIISLVSFYLPILVSFTNTVSKGIVFILEKVDLIKISIPINLTSDVALFLYYGAIIFIIYFKEIGFKKYQKLSMSVLLVNILLSFTPIDNMMISSVNFINIGQGDACLIKDGLRNYMIDVGGNVNDDLALNSLIPYLNKQKVYKLDAIFISHYDYDHYGALESLKKHFRVGEVYDLRSTYPVKRGRITFYNVNNRMYESTNDNSVVLYFTFLNMKWLFTGDIGTEVEENIVLDYKGLDVDILKVAHHGSINSYSEQFIRDITPKEAVISCGKNYYGHPDPKILDLLKKYNIKIRRTDKEGTISYKNFAFNV